MHTVFGLVKDNGRGRTKNVIAYLDTVKTGNLVDLIAYLGMGVMEGWQAVHVLYGGIVGLAQQGDVNTVGEQEA